MPRISEFLGIYIYMYYTDHGPAHFHAIYGQYDAAIEIQTGVVLAGSLPPRVSALVREWCESYRGELAANWERARRHERLEWIPGLE